MTEIAFSRRWKLWLIAWAVALIAVGRPAIHYVWYFPLGLLPLLGRKQPAHDLDFFVGWFLYLILTVAGLCSRRRALYYTFYVILCVLLIVNVIGCRQMK